MKKLSHLLLFFFLLQSCSSSKRVNEKPDFTLTGAAASQEIKKFKLEHVSLAGGRFEQEGAFTVAEKKKLRPLMNDISPKSVEMLDKTQTEEIIYWTIFGAWISTIFIKNSDGNISSLYWVGFGATLGYGFYLNALRNDVVDRYNEDLKSKFSPTVGYNFTF